MLEGVNEFEGAGWRVSRALGEAERTASMILGGSSVRAFWPPNRVASRGVRPTLLKQLSLREQWTLIRERMSASRDEGGLRMFIQEAMPPVRPACDSSGIIVHCCLKDGEAVGICGTRRAEEVPGRLKQWRLRGPGAAGCLAAGSDGRGGGLPIATSFFLPVERNLPIHLRRGPGQDPVDNEPGDLGPMGSKGNSCYLLGGAADKDDPSPP